MTFGRNGDQDAIIATMGAFKDAIAAGDVGAVTAQMCAEEAALLDGLELQAGTPPPPPAESDDADAASAGIADLQVKGDVAAATVTDAPDAEKKVYFRKEGEQWKVCSFAKADFDAAA
jgi:ketosteroid isomerase-like protein